MKDPVKEWLPQRVIVAGVMAGGLRRPNGKLAVQCADASCPPAAMENLLRQLDGSRNLFPTTEPQPKLYMGRSKSRRHGRPHAERP